MFPTSPVLLAIDPSIRCSGVAIINGDKIVAHGLIKPKLIGVGRYKELQRLVADCIQKYHPDILAIETQYIMFGKHMGDAIIKTALARGLFIGVFLNLVPHGVVVDVTPTQAKHALGLSGGRTKRDEAKVEAMAAVKRLYNLDVSNDVADAIGIGFAGAGLARLNQAIS